MLLKSNNLFQSPKNAPKSPNFLSKVKTFKKLDRRGSIFFLIKEAKAIKNESLENDESKSIMSSEFSKEEDSSNLQSNIIQEENKIKSSNKSHKLNTQQNIDLHRYKENKLPILTNSSQILNEVQLVNKRDNYYKKNVSNNNFGKKFAVHNLAYRSYDVKDEEEFIQLMGLNDEEKDPLNVIKSKKININKENGNFLLFKTAHQRIEIKKNISENKRIKKRDNINNILFNENIKIKKMHFSSFTKKDEFTEFLISNYLKIKFPDFMNDAPNGKSRRIYVIKNSTIIYNSKRIPGFFVQIPTAKEMNKYPSNKRKIIMNQFYDFISKKFQSKLLFNHIFTKNRYIIQDFALLPENDNYIYVSNTASFEGLLLPLNKNLIQTYQKYFTEKEVDKFYFNESSLDESIYTQSNDTKKNNDDIYDIYFKRNNKKIKKFKKKKKNKNKNSKLNNSYTFGINEDSCEYLYYSEDEKRKKYFQEIQYKLYKNNIDFYIKSHNELYNQKINLLLSKLSSNKTEKNSYINKKYHKPKDELIKDYLTEKNIPIKNLSKETTKKKVTNQGIIDAFNLLKNQDPTIDINKFIKKRKNAPPHLPYVEKNILDNTNKYYFCRAILDKEFPSTLSYNFPKIVQNNHKYSLSDLIKYFTKFKSLINLWLNMHPFAKVEKYGIDFETFYHCTEDICTEQEILVKKIFNKINTGTLDILSLEDYVDGLIALNRDDLLDQIEFFLKVFNSKNKRYFNYKEIFEISKLSIKRLLKIKNKIEIDMVSDDLGEYLAHFIFQICNSKPDNGIEISKLKSVLANDINNEEFLKLFMCSFGESKIKIDKNINLKAYKKRRSQTFENQLNNLKNEIF